MERVDHVDGRVWTVIRAKIKLLFPALVDNILSGEFLFAATHARDLLWSLVFQVFLRNHI